MSSHTQAQVGRAVIGHHFGQGVFYFVGKGWNPGFDVLQATQTGQIFDGVVGAAHDSVAVAATVAHQKNGQIVQASIVAKLFQTPINHKRRNAVTKHFIAFVGHACRHAYHILFGHARVDEAFTEFGLYIFEGIVTQVARDKND